MNDDENINNLEIIQECTQLCASGNNIQENFIEKDLDISDHAQSDHPQSDQKISKPWYCYILHCCNNTRTYVGVTVSLKKRIRQHNGEIKGGARATTRSRPWKYWCVWGPFDKRTALQLEWRLHRQTPYKKSCLQRRMCQIFSALDMVQWTSKAKLISTLNFWILWKGGYEDDYDLNSPIQEGLHIVRQLNESSHFENDNLKITPVQNQYEIQNCAIIKSIDATIILDDFLTIEAGQIAYYQGNKSQSISFEGNILVVSFEK